ncbi:unnamed protein product, partial [Tetraodon nigroviridis]
VVFEVAFNRAKGGYVAVDDISFSPEFCHSDTEPTVDPSVADCDFDTGLCLYHQERAESKGWSRVTVSPNAYRMGDHTTGTGDPTPADSHKALDGPVLVPAGLTVFVSLRLVPPGERALRLHARLRGAAARALVAGEPALLREVLLPAAGLQEGGQRSDPLRLRRARRGGGEGLEPVRQLRGGVDAGGGHLPEADADQGPTPVGD